MSFNEPAEGKKQKLGRGLSALLGEEGVALGRGGQIRKPSQVPIGNLRPNRLQPRTSFDPAQLQELADSIHEKGILQPILVRPAGNEPDHYEIIAGERRWRAAQLARLHEVPVIVRELGDDEALELALIENIQRADLNPMEEARGYGRLIDQFGHIQEDVSRLVGKSRSHVANMLRLLTLQPTVQAMIEDGRLSAGHARALINSPDMEALAQRIVAAGMSVREAEALAKGRKPAVKLPPVMKDPNIAAVEAHFSGILGLKVTISDHGEKGGTVSIAYRTPEQFDHLSKRLLRNP